MPLQLYANFISQPSRTVIWVLKVKNIDFNLVEKNPGSDFFKTDEFGALNPNRLVPVIKDDDFVLTEGMTILLYLSDKLGWNGPKDLYPKDVKVRAKIHEYLHWHHTNTRLFTINIFRPATAKQSNSATGKDLEALGGTDDLIAKVFGLLEVFLVNDYIAHTNFPTIADFAAYCEIDQLELMGFQFSKYPKVAAWIGRMKKTAYNEEVHQKLEVYIDEHGLRNFRS
uniref:Glutathione S-transferase n=1 Tax=Peronospora matthiolae TaxID=2874970 RepID=A0AAV1T2T5_9STRA